MKKKFSAAFNGLYLAFMHRSCRIQFIFGFLAVVCGLVLALTFGEWLAFILCIGLVITMEIMNTAIEKLCDLVDNKYNPQIKIIKDSLPLLDTLSNLINSDKNFNEPKKQQKSINEIKE